MTKYERATSQPKIGDLAERFCVESPHRMRPYSSRNWGGPLHSLCSYQGKLKPSIAHFLIDWFTKPGDIVVDPMAGVGTVPLEARRLGRVGVGGDLSPLAYAVTSPKLERINERTLESDLTALSTAVTSDIEPPALAQTTSANWGLNKPIKEYFHSDTLGEILRARSFFLKAPATPEMNLLRASTMHVLHGNRPYALSRRSHPVTPLAPRGEFEYRSLIEKVEGRLSRVMDPLRELNLNSPEGQAIQCDFRDLDLRGVDAVITSPPFARSLRFWSSNWMRLWFAGWEEADFKLEPPRYLETQQRESYDPYIELLATCARMLKPGGLLIFHLGQTMKENMVERIEPLLEPAFEAIHTGLERVEDTESHGLKDKGATIAHWYLFARLRG